MLWAHSIVDTRHGHIELTDKEAREELFVCYIANAPSTSMVDDNQRATCCGRTLSGVSSDQDLVAVPHADLMVRLLHIGKFHSCRADVGFGIGEELP